MPPTKMDVGVRRAAELRLTHPDTGGLGITTRAAERHISSIFWKLGLGDSEHVSRRVKAALMYLVAQVG